MKIGKKIVAGILALLLIVTGLYFVPSEGEEAQASTATEVKETGAVVLGTEQLEEGTVAADKTPVPSGDTYDDYLFAGWFTSKDCTLETAVTDKTQIVLDNCYAKFVPKDILSVKVQTANYKVKEVVDGDEKVAEYGAIRFISSVESLDYKEVGFRVNGTDYSMEKTVYDRIESNVTKEDSTEKLTYEFSPKVVSTKSEYFVTAKMAVSEADVEKNHAVQAYWTTLDGIKIYGDVRSINVADNENVDINVPLKVRLSGTGYAVTYGGKAVESYEIINVDDTTQPSTLRVTLPVALETLPSATEILVKSGDDTVGRAIYRNYYTEYTGNDVGDQTWYTVDKNASEFIIASAADLYGFANIVNTKTDTTLFKNDTIYMVKDIVINKDPYSTSAYEWNRIGNDKVAFAGTFDGDYNTISGVKDTEAYAPDGTFATNTQMHGLFANIAVTSEVRNLRVKSSQFKFETNMNNGVVVAYLQGEVRNIYVEKDVSVTSTQRSTGGIVGMISVGNPNYTGVVENCWFAGTITNTGNKTVGGVVGECYRGYARVKNCLNTGTVITENASGTAGGLIGTVEGSGSSETTTKAYRNRTTFTECINVGSVRTMNSTRAGGAIGYIGGNTDLTISKIYAIDDVTCTTEGAELTIAINGIGAYSQVETSTINGLPVRFEEETRLQGDDAYTNTELDFWSNNKADGVWCAISEKTPELKMFSTEEPIEQLTGVRKTREWYYGQYNKPATKSVKLALPTSATYEIGTVEELMGFADIVNNTSNGELFASDTIKLTGNINLNPGWVPSINAKGELQNVPTNEWTPIGIQSSSTTWFNGTFDGQGYAISGIYVDATTRDAGLFGITGTASQIKNITMVNSYIDDNGKTYVGSVAATFRGTLLDQIYVADSVYIYGSNYVGGIAGMKSASATLTISNCLFDGNIYASGHKTGGILGRSYAGNNTIKNCMYTGNIVSTYSGDDKATVGGIIGDTNDKVAVATTIMDCLSIGSVQVSKDTYVDSAIGEASVEDLEDGVTMTVTIVDVYTINNISHLTDSEVTFATSNGTIVDDTALKTDASVAIPNLFKMSDGTTENAVDNNAWVNVPGSYPVLSWTIAED